MEFRPEGITEIIQSKAMLLIAVQQRVVSGTIDIGVVEIKEEIVGDIVTNIRWLASCF